MDAWFSSPDLALNAAPGVLIFRYRAGLLSHSYITNVGSDKQPKYRPTEVVPREDE